MTDYIFVPEVGGWTRNLDTLPVRPAGPWDNNVAAEKKLAPTATDQIDYQRLFLEARAKGGK